MKIAIVHYHLRKGGVTRVIENAVASLGQAEVEIAVLAGEAYDGDQLPSTHVVEGLNYRATATDDDAAALYDNLVRTAETVLGGAPDIWHIHNHSLGKNVAFPAVLNRLLQDGAKVLLQIHDFAEDGRPLNYARQKAFFSQEDDFPVYPSGSQVHYATLNQRDAGHLRATSLPEGNLHLLPNSVSPPPQAPRPDDLFAGAERFILYPTRGIRRKNLGELVLLRTLTGPGTVFASTLRPDNPEWLPVHEAWETFVARHDLPVHLAYGERAAHTYPQLLSRADTIITTSVAEGFGLAFLEPWLGDKTVVGRDLPAITSDFGINLSHLYDRLMVPLEWLDRDRLAAEMQSHASTLYQNYGRNDPSNWMDLTDRLLDQEEIDFGKLNEPLQRQIINRAMKEPGRIPCPDLDPAPAGTIAQTRALVESGFGNAAYGDRLLDLYQTVAASPASEIQHLDPDALLDAFLDPASFTLLRA